MQAIADWSARLTTGWPADPPAQHELALHLFQNVDDVCRNGAAPALLDWLQHLPADVRDGNPLLRFTEAACLSYLGQHRAAQQLAVELWQSVTHDAPAATHDAPAAPSEEPLPAGFAAAATVLAAGCAAAAGACTDALHIITNSRADYTPAQQAQLIWTACRAQYMQGNHRQALTLAQQFLANRGADRYTRIQALAALAEMHADLGQFTIADDLVGQAEAELARLPYKGLHCRIAAARAHLLVAQDDLPAALRVTERALKAASPADDDNRIALLLTHARILGMLGHWSDQAAVLTELDGIAAAHSRSLPLALATAWARHDACTGQADLAVQRIASILERLDDDAVGHAWTLVELAEAAEAAGWPGLTDVIDHVRLHMPDEHFPGHAHLAWLEAKEAFRLGLPFAEPLAAFVRSCERVRLTAVLGRAAREAPHILLAGVKAGIVSPLYAAVLPLLATEQLNDLAAIATDSERPARVRQVAWHLLARQADSPVTIQAAQELSGGAHAATARADAGLAAAAARLLQSRWSGRPQSDSGMIEFRTLGEVALTYRGRQTTVPWRRKAQALFALLIASHPRPLTRLQAQEALWPELCQQAAANNLRVVVHNLRRTLASLFASAPNGGKLALDLVCSGDAIWLDGADAVHWDARALTAAVAAARSCVAVGDLPGAMIAFSHAVALYRGPFMPDPAHDTTFALDRAHYEHLAHEAMLELAALHLDHGDPEQALVLAERAIEIDPLDEIGHQLAMRAHAALGYPHRAAAAYARYTETVAAQRGMRPDGTTERLLHQLLQSFDTAVAAIG